MRFMVGVPKFDLVGVTLENDQRMSRLAGASVLAGELRCLDGKVDDPEYGSREW